MAPWRAAKPGATPAGAMARAARGQQGLARHLGQQLLEPQAAARGDAPRRIGDHAQRRGVGGERVAGDRGDGGRP